MKIDINRLVEDIFGDLGFELSSPKEYALSFMNYFLRILKEKDWVSGYQIDDISISDRESTIGFYLVNSLLPVRFEVFVRQDIDYDTKGVLYLVYEVELSIVTEINFITDQFHKAEEFLLYPSGDISPTVERIDDSLFELSGELKTTMSEQFIPISTIEEDESLTKNWSVEEKEKTNFAALALAIANFIQSIDIHYNETVQLYKWFKERKIGIGASSEPFRR